MIEDLFEFINNSRTSFEAVKNTESILIEKGFKRLYEYETYNICPGKYYVIRNNSSIIAINIPKDIVSLPINIISTHTDSPSLKLTPNNIIKTSNYITLQTEVYGGPIYSTWFDRPLGISGRIVVKDGNDLKEIIISIKDALVIPNLCIHFNRDINNGYNYNAAIDMKPILSNDKALNTLIAEKYNLKEEDIISTDLYVVCDEEAKVVGANKEFFMAPRIDNLASHYTALKAFIESDDTFKLFVSFDNEEVGSRSMQGAASDFLIETLKRIYKGLGINEEEMYKSLSHSIMISADNAHALHPNYLSAYNLFNAPTLNNGYVIKYNASQNYTTDAISSAILKKLSDDSGIKYQEFANRPDKKGGSTLGNILQQSLSIHMVDIGLPQLAMHSAYETAGVEDIKSYYEIMKVYYNSNIKFDNDKIKI